MKKKRRLVTGLVIFLVIAVMASINALAAQEEKVFGLGAVKDGEIVAISAAFVLQEDGDYLVLGDDFVLSREADSYFIQNMQDSKTYDVVFEGSVISEYKLALFTLQNQIPPASQIVKPGLARKGQTVEFVYLDEEAEAASAGARLVGARESGSFIALEIEILDEVGSVHNPVILLDDSGNMAALGTPSSEVIAFYTDLKTFNGSTEERGTEPSEPEKPPESEQPAYPSRAAPVNPQPQPQKPWWENDAVSGGMIGVVAALIGFIIIAVTKSKKKTSGTIHSPADSNPLPQQSGTPSHQTPAQPAAPSAQSVSPSPRPVPAPDYRPFGTTVIGTAGNMVNQVYTVTNSGLTFGRDASCFVRFPEDAKGVSRTHCRLHLDDAGNLVLTDCNATYGTHVKRHGTTKPVRLEANASVRLYKGDKFYLGSNQISFMVQ